MKRGFLNSNRRKPGGEKAPATSEQPAALTPTTDSSSDQHPEYVDALFLNSSTSSHAVVGQDRSPKPTESRQLIRPTPDSAGTPSPVDSKLRQQGLSMFMNMMSIFDPPVLVSTSPPIYRASSDRKSVV